MSSLPLRTLVASLAVAALAACGGDVFSPTDGGNSNDGGGTSDGGGTNDGGLTIDCPSSIPSSGANCAKEGLECEYGTSAELQCNTLATCQGGHWNVVPPVPDACQPPSSKCPPSFAQVPVDQACPDAVGTTCDYPQGTCGCTDYFGGPVPADAAAAARWYCDNPAPGCPMPRPRIGSPCSQEGQECNYSPCTPSGTGTLCQNGTWHEQMIACAQ